MSLRTGSGRSPESIVARLLNEEGRALSCPPLAVSILRNPAVTLPDQAATASIVFFSHSSPQIITAWPGETSRNWRIGGT